MQLFSLFGKIFLKDDASNPLEKVDKKAKGIGGRLGNLTKTAAKMGAGLAAGAFLAGGAFIAMATKAGGAADRILDLNSITGMSTESIQRWEKATKIAGVSADSVTNASQKLTKSMDAMSSETHRGNVALRQLGLSFDDIQNMNADQRMDAITKALAGVEDKTERARIGTDLLGRSWKDIAPIVDMGAEAMDRAKASANVISEENLNRANNFRISMEVLKDRVSFLAMELAIRLLPIAEKVFEVVEVAMPHIMKIVGVAFDFIGKGMEILINWITKIITWLNQWRKENEGTLLAIRDTFINFFKALYDLISAFINFAIMMWQKFGDDIMAILRPIINNVILVISSAFKIITDIFNIFAALFRGDWSGLWNAVKSLFSNVWNLVTGMFRNYIDMTLGYVRNFGKVFTAIWRGIFNGVKSLTDAVMGSIVNGIRGSINMVLRALNAMIRGLNRIRFDIPRWVPVIGGNSWGMNIPEIPMLAKGGKVTKPTFAMIGEGVDEEAVLPLNKNVYTELAKGISEQMGTKTGETKIIIEKMEVREESDIKKIARELYNLQQQKLRPKGAW